MLRYLSLIGVCGLPRLSRTVATNLRRVGAEFPRPGESWSTARESNPAVPANLVAPTGIEPVPRANLALAGYKAAVLPLNYGAIGKMEIFPAWTFRWQFSHIATHLANSAFNLFRLMP